MTTPTPAPRFETTGRRHGLRAIAIGALCAALAGGFVASTWRLPARGPAHDTGSTVTTCTPTAARAC